MGAVTNSAVTARGRTRQRAAVQLADRAERDARIAAAAARAAAAQDAIRANAERRALAVAAAEQAIAAAERDERDANAARRGADPRGGACAPGRRAHRRRDRGAAAAAGATGPAVHQTGAHAGSCGAAAAPRPDAGEGEAR